MSFTTRGTETTCDACGAEIEPPVTWRAMSDHERAGCVHTRDDGPAWLVAARKRQREGK